MQARVTHSRRDPATIDEGIRLLHEKVIPALRKTDGFKRFYWLVDRKAGKAMSVAFYENDEALQSSEEVARQLREKSTSQITSVDVYEVIVEG